MSAITRSGLADWLIQRFSAVVLLAYVLCLLGFLLSYGGEVDFARWRAFFDGAAMQIFTLIAALALICHAWIGIWTILTDYVKLAFVRLLLSALFALFLLALLLWIALILWAL